MILHHGDVVRLRPLQHQHAGRVDVLVLGGDFGVARGDVVEDFSEERKRLEDVRLVDARDESLAVERSSAPFLRKLKRKSSDPLGAGSRDDLRIGRDFVIQNRTAAKRREQAFEVFSQNDEVNLRIGAERRFDSGVPLDRPHRRVDVEGSPQTHHHRRLNFDSVSSPYIRQTECSEEYGIRRAAVFDDGL